MRIRKASVFWRKSANEENNGQMPQLKKIFADISY